MCLMPSIQDEKQWISHQNTGHQPENRNHKTITKLTESRKKGKKFDLVHALSFCSISHSKTSFKILKNVLS